jgi:formamidopyrimidine-DNA glycosylase
VGLHSFEGEANHGLRQSSGVKLMRNVLHLMKQITMPELPEVEMARRYLEATSLCQTIKMAQVNDDRILSGVSAGLLEQSLVGQQFHSAYRHGKRLFLSLKEDLWLTLHLGLTGRLVYLQSAEDEPGHTRLLITFENNYRLAFDDTRIFGEVSVVWSP